MLFPGRVQVAEKTHSALSKRQRMLCVFAALTFIVAMIHFISLNQVISKYSYSEQVVSGPLSSNNGSGEIPAKQGTILNPTRRKSHHVTNIKIVGFTDMDFLQVAKFWYARMTKLGYKEHVLVAIDQEVLNVLKRERADGEPYRVEEWFVDPGKRRMNKVRSLWSRRIDYTVETIKNGTSLLLTDVDNIFMKYIPLSQFQESEYDVMHAYAFPFPGWVYEKQGFVICGGMTWFTANTHTLAYVKMVQEKCGSFRCNDQVEYNRLIYDQLNMQWDRDPFQVSRTSDGFVETSLVGKSNITGHSIKIWDHNIAWRGSFSDNVPCPSHEKNWVAMPGALPFGIQTEFKLDKDGPKEKLARVMVWEHFCGSSGTNRHPGIKEPLRQAFFNLKEEGVSF